MGRGLQVFRIVRDQRGIQVVVVIALYLFFAALFPLKVHQGFYTTSLFIKDLLIFLLPMTVCMFIADAVCSFQKRAPLFIALLVLFEAFSNLSSVWYAYFGAHITSNFLPSIPVAEMNLDFTELWRLPWTKPSWWSPEKGTFVGLFLGILGAFSQNTKLVQGIQVGKTAMQWILTKIFSRLIPLFVLGFVAKMYTTRLIQQMLTHYSILLLWMMVLLAVYIAFLFLVGNGWRLHAAFRAVKNLMPPGIFALTSACSLSTMPWTIAGTSKNLKNPEFAQAVIPATTNIQQIGDCLVQAFLCFLIYQHFYGHPPDIVSWIGFSAVFVLARFATAAVLGGAIFIMLPIYEAHLSFNAEMIAIILAFNVLLDPLITMCNVIANGALCQIFEQVWYRFSRKNTKSQETAKTQD